jgi:flagellar biosynthetic protein FliO
MKNIVSVPLTAGLLWLVQSGISVAQEYGPPSPGTIPVTGALDSIWPSIGRLAITLVLVIGLIWATMWLARKFMKGRWAGASDANVRILERVHLAPKKSIDIVSIGNRVLVLGVTDTHVGLLTELPPGDFPIPSREPKTTADKLAQQGSPQRDAWKQARQRMRDLFQSARLSGVDIKP